MYCNVYSQQFIQYTSIFILYILSTYNPISIDYTLYKKKSINRYCIAMDLDTAYQIAL